MPQRPLALVGRDAKGKGTGIRQEVLASECFLLHCERSGVGIVHESLLCMHVGMCNFIEAGFSNSVYLLC